MTKVLPFPGATDSQAEDLSRPVAQYCDYEGYQLAYEVHGNPEAPPIILIHGIMLDAACNRDLAEVLADTGYRVILLDLLGHGRSDKPGHAKELRIDFFAEQVRTLMDHLGIEDAVVGGVSLGAITTLSFAALHPQRVRAMFLEMPVMERATPAAALMLVPVIGMVRFAAPIPRTIARLLRKLPRPSNNLVQVAYNLLTQEPEDIAAIIHGVLVGPVVPPRRVRRELEMPTMIIGHGGDWLHNLEDAQVLQRELPNAELEVARSMVELRLKPQRLLPKILDFMHRVEPLPSAKSQA